MRINLDNVAEIERALAEVNGLAKTHTLTHAYQIQAVTKEAEAAFDRAGLPLKDRKGARLVYIPAGPGKAYARKSREVVSTVVRLDRGAKGWFLTSANRTELWATSARRFCLTIDGEQAEVVKRKALEPFVVA